MRKPERLKMMFNIAQMAAIKKMECKEPKTITGRAVMAAGKYLDGVKVPGVGSISSNLPMLAGIAEKSPEFREAFLSWIRDVNDIIRSADEVSK